MIIVKLIGGLGNQLFQYSFGRSLSLQNNTLLGFDIRDLQDRTPKNNFTYRDFRLNLFNIKGEIVNSKQLTTFFPTNFLGKIRKHVYKKLSLLHEIYEENNDNTFHQEYIVKSKIIYLKGYWQSEKYFKEFASPIRKELLLKNEYIHNYANIAEKINSQNSISIHFRRGDYVSNPGTNVFHGVCPMQYYVQAIQYLKKIFISTHFYVFSDDINWVKNNNVWSKEFTFLEGYPDYIDLYLMSLCKHNIIANSSFSWWAAWLNNNPEKIVIAPKNWYAITSIMTSDLIPQNWITL